MQKWETGVLYILFNGDMTLDGDLTLWVISPLNIYIRHPFSIFIYFLIFLINIFPPKYTTGIINNCLKEVKFLDGMKRSGAWFCIGEKKKKERKVISPYSTAIWSYDQDTKVEE